jgi:multicomponent Na+:H+ antiporter subunit E
MAETTDLGSVGPGVSRRLAVVSRTTLLVLVWWVLSDGAAASWWIGGPAVIAAAAVSMVMLPPQRFSWLALFRFMPFFVRHSLLGGVDVARRTFHPALPIDPDLVEYRVGLPPGLPRVVMACVVNLLPGTLVAMFDQSLLKVHVLDRREDYRAELETIERGIAGMFRVMPGAE